MSKSISVILQYIERKGWGSMMIARVSPIRTWLPLCCRLLFTYMLVFHVLFSAIHGINWAVAFEACSVRSVDIDIIITISAYMHIEAYPNGLHFKGDIYKNFFFEVDRTFRFNQVSQRLISKCQVVYVSGLVEVMFCFILRGDKPSADPVMKIRLAPCSVTRQRWVNVDIRHTICHCTIISTAPPTASNLVSITIAETFPFDSF